MLTPVCFNFYIASSIWVLKYCIVNFSRMLKIFSLQWSATNIIIFVSLTLFHGQDKSRLLQFCSFFETVIPKMNACDERRRTVWRLYQDVGIVGTTLLCTSRIEWASVGIWIKFFIWSGIGWFFLWLVKHASIPNAVNDSLAAKTWKQVWTSYGEWRLL